MILEPIPSLSAVMMALKSTKIPDSELSRRIAEMDQRVRSTKSADAACWPGIYRDVLTLLPSVVDASDAAMVARDLAKQARDSRERVSKLAVEAQCLVQKDSAEWPTRLARQEKELGEKVSRAVERLRMQATDDPNTGETIYGFAPEELGLFWQWLSGAAEGWVANNQELVAARANETLRRGGVELEDNPCLRIDSTTLPSPTPVSAKLKGYSVPTVGLLDSLGRTYKAVIAGFGSLSMLGFAVTRIAGNSGFVRDVLPWFFGVAFVCTALFVVLTYPKHRRQAQARVTTKAREQIERELRDVARLWLKDTASTQLQVIRRHLSNESIRLKALTKEVEPGPFEPVADCIPAATIDRIRGEWTTCLRSHLAQISGD